MKDVNVKIVKDKLHNIRDHTEKKGPKLKALNDLVEGLMIFIHHHCGKLILMINRFLSFRNIIYSLL